MLRVEFHPAAFRESNESVRWYRLHAGDPIAQGFKSELSRVIDSVRRFPHIGPPYMASTRRVVLKGYPYLFVYTPQPDSIWVIAVAHCSRKPGYWRRRRATP